MERSFINHEPVYNLGAGIEGAYKELHNRGTTPSPTGIEKPKPAARVLAARRGKKISGPVDEKESGMW
jgi:hypothetical protein